MYIQSQDKDLIANFQKLTIDNFGDDQYHIYDSSCMRIASYPTKERCVEVLDECYECLKRGNISYEFPEE